MRAAGMIFLAYIGFDAVSTAAQEAKTPQRDMPIGIIGSLAICTVLYVIPATSVLGAVLLTGYLGGAVSVQVRVGNPLFGYVLFPVYVAVLMWAGLCLRESRLLALLPLRK